MSQIPTNEVVPLDTPIQRGELSIEKITIRKPMSGELRGVSLIDLMNMDVMALRKVLPRITDPTLTDMDVARMDPADLVQCGVAVTSFLLTKSAKAQASQSL
ncbi:MAG: phage tail assembly protein [Pseudomonas helleri]|uniref:phage tail assembly protein n=1 Tax=Pseudomonas helleri TaxID=1608996 RepID=UPI003F9B121B